jgi:hypothetical protein
MRERSGVELIASMVEVLVRDIHRGQVTPIIRTGKVGPEDRVEATTLAAHQAEFKESVTSGPHLGRPANPLGAGRPTGEVAQTVPEQTLWPSNL